LNTLRSNYYVETGKGNTLKQAKKNETKVHKQGLAKSIHHARVLIRQRHIRVGSQLVNVPSFNVRTSSEKHIDFATNSPYGQGKPGRVARKRAASKAAAGDEEE